MHTPRTVHRVQQPRHRSCSVSASTSAPLPREYELQEPRTEGRAIDPAAVERMFDATLGAHISPGDLEQIWRGQPGPPADRAWPDPAGAWYCTGIDWAQKRDSHRRRRRALRDHAAPGRRRRTAPSGDRGRS